MFAKCEHDRRLTFMLCLQFCKALVELRDKFMIFHSYA